jgi:hypothetical protein
MTMNQTTIFHLSMTTQMKPKALTVMSTLGVLNGINTLATSELASRPTKPVDASSPWYDVEEGYVEEPALRHGSCEQQGVISTPAQDQPQTLP